MDRLLVATASLVLGLLGNFMLRTTPWGINATLWVLLLAAATAIMVRRSGRSSMLAAPPVVFFALCLSWRTAPMLVLANLIAILVGLSFLILQWRAIELRGASVSTYLAGFWSLLRNFTVGGAAFLSHDVSWSTSSAPAVRRTLTSSGLGILAAIPVVLVFGALFVSADPRFQSAIERMLIFDVERQLFHLGFTGLFALMSAGYLREFLQPRQLSLTTSAKSYVGLIEVGIPLGAMILLFAWFMGFQLPYLFGGVDVVRSTPDLSLAHYAKRGFFELATATGLVLPVLMVLHRRLDPASRLHQRVFCGLAVTQLVLVGALMASATHRLWLYIDAFGLTESRIYGLTFIAWTACSLGWFARTSLRGSHTLFASRALATGLLLLGLLNVLNPQALVVRTNVERARVGEALDSRYLARLGADAVPALVDALPDLGHNRCAVAWRIEAISIRWHRDWRSWSVARFRADRATRASSAFARECPAPVISRARMPFRASSARRARLHQAGTTVVQRTFL
jgi:hypothetical protein